MLQIFYPSNVFFSCSVFCVLFRIIIMIIMCNFLTKFKSYTVCRSVHFKRLNAAEYKNKLKVIARVLWSFIIFFLQHGSALRLHATRFSLSPLSRCFFSAVCFVFFGWLCEDYSWRHGIAVFAPLSWVYVGRRAHDVTVLQSSHDRTNDDDVHTRETEWASEEVRAEQKSWREIEREKWERERGKLLGKVEGELYPYHIYIEVLHWCNADFFIDRKGESNLATPRAKISTWWKVCRLSSLILPIRRCRWSEEDDFVRVYETHPLRVIQFSIVMIPTRDDPKLETLEKESILLYFRATGGKFFHVIY